jgi:pyruvate, water dikinase
MGTFIVSLQDIREDDVERCGGKAASLGKLVRMGVAVPPGFCIAAEALPYVLDAGGLTGRIVELARKIDFHDLANIEAACEEIRMLIASTRIPEQLSRDICRSYTALVTPTNRYVAVRSSVAVQDTSISSFPGLMDTYHYVLGEDQVIEKVRECWASLWSTRAAHKRYHKRIPHNKAIIAPVVQLMVNSETAGVLFTANPVTKDKSEVLIEANWGLGESVVSGKSMNDYFVIDKATLAVRQRKIAHKTLMTVADEGRGSGRIELPVPPARAVQATLSDAQLLELAEYGRRIETHFGFSVDVEWAYDDGHLYILQARKIRDLD